MMEDKKLKDSELEQVSGGYGTEVYKGHVVNPNGTDLCSDNELHIVIRHLDYQTEVKYLAKGVCVTYVIIEHVGHGYINSNDLR